MRGDFQFEPTRQLGLFVVYTQLVAFLLVVYSSAAPLLFNCADKRRANQTTNRLIILMIGVLLDVCSSYNLNGEFYFESLNE